MRPFTTTLAMTLASKTLFTLLAATNLAWAACFSHSQRTLREQMKKSSGLVSAVHAMRVAFLASRDPNATRAGIINAVQGTFMAEPAVERDGYWWWGAVGMSFTPSGRMTDVLVRSELADQRPLPNPNEEWIEPAVPVQRSNEGSHRPAPD